MHDFITRVCSCNIRPRDLRTDKNIVRITSDNRRSYGHLLYDCNVLKSFQNHSIQSFISQFDFRLDSSVVSPCAS